MIARYIELYRSLGARLKVQACAGSQLISIFAVRDAAQSSIDRASRTDAAGNGFPRTGGILVRQHASRDSRTLLSGAQPVVDSSTGNVIVVNGEIYNHRALRKELGDVNGAGQATPRRFCWVTRAGGTDCSIGSRECSPSSSTITPGRSFSWRATALASSHSITRWMQKVSVSPPR